MTTAAPERAAGARATSATLQVLVLGMLLVLATACTAASRPDATVTRNGDSGGYRSGTSVLDPYVLPDRILTDTAGNAYNLRTSPSRPVTLLFFGYTHCPDVCADVLAQTASALGRLPQSARDQVQLIFITTDPARDSPRVIERYLDRFDPDFLGLTSDLATVEAVADRVGVEVEGRQRLPGGGYEVGHGAQLIGFDHRRRGVVMWTPSTPVGDLTADLGLLVARQQ